MTARRPRPPRPGVLMVVVVLVLALGGVAGAARALAPSGAVEADHAGEHHGAASASHEHAAGGDAAAPAPVDDCPPGQPTAAETAYVEHMVEHHRQAVRMAGLLRQVPGVPYRTQNLADHIAFVQRGEVQDMRTWLQAWRDAPVPDGCRSSSGSHGGSGGHHQTAGSGAARGVPDPRAATMPGMLGAADLASLTTASDGESASRRFLSLMVEHHRGAVTMSGPVVREATNPWVLSLARHVVADQAIEIDAMQRILAQS